MRRRFSLQILSLVLVGVTLYHFATLLSVHPAPESFLDLQDASEAYQYFTEVEFHYNSKLIGAVSHSDSRYTNTLNMTELHQVLPELLKSYTSTMDSLGFETWIAHGTLLGWFWGRKILPWDTDIDVQISGTTLQSLAKYNMTQYSLESGGMNTYLLDINPYHSFVSTRDAANKIDARWIDMRNGKYIDITALHKKPESGMLMCKDGHQYTASHPGPRICRCLI